MSLDRNKLHYFSFLTCKGVMPKCSFTYLPKKEVLGKPRCMLICLTVRSVCFRWLNYPIALI